MKYASHTSSAEAAEQEMGKDDFVQTVDHMHCGLSLGLLTGKGAEQEQGFQTSKRRLDYHNVAYH
jgi:hypothetical protein